MSVPAVLSLQILSVRTQLKLSSLALHSIDLLMLKLEGVMWSFPLNKQQFCSNSVSLLAPGVLKTAHYVMHVFFLVVSSQIF